MFNLYIELVDLLNIDERLTSEGKLLKNKVVELAYKADKDLIKLLLSNPQFKELFFQDVDGVLVFNQSKFQTFISNKQFLPDSFTSFKNKIGLTNENGEFISQSKEVVLSFPYKDCVLEGGQNKEDAKRDEIFYNKILASDEIDRLFEPKVLTNFRKFDKDGEHEVNGITENDNLIIKGNNLLALHSLRKKYAGKIKVIYIDPPYNTGSDGFNYNDAFNHSTWLTFIKNRLEIARDLLRADGVIFISCDDNEQGYLKVLADEVFDRNNFVTNIIWEKKYTIANDARFFSDNHDFISVWSKDISKLKLNREQRTEAMDKAYSNPDNHPKGEWKATPLHAKSGNDTKFEHTFPNGIKFIPPKGTYTRFSHQKLDELYSKDEIWFGKDGKSIPSRKTFLSELRNEGIIPRTIWQYNEAGHNHEAKAEINQLLKDEVFSSPKPVRLLKKIIEIGMGKEDIILDFFCGSGTTAHAILELNKEDKGNRKFILVEQMDYIETVTTKRVHQVIKNDDLETSFIRLNLKVSNEQFLNDIQNTKDLAEVLNKIKQNGFLTHKVDLERLDENGFVKLSEAEQRGLLMEILDANHLYVNLNDIDDTRFKVSEEDKRLNKQFYSI